MKKKLLFMVALLVGISAKTFATHDIGGSLTYNEIAPNTFVFSYQHYNWAGLANNPNSLSLQVSSPGCSIARTVPLTFLNQRVGGYGPFGNGITHYMISTLTGVVTFTPAEVACSNMVVSVSSGPGQASGNLTANTNQISIYTEATIKLIPGQLFNSPVFDYRNEPVLLASKYQPISLSVAATDADGDSLVYSMVAPLVAHNQPVTNYAAFTTGNGYVVNPFPQVPYSNPNNPQVAVFTGSTNYSPTFPLLSYQANFASGQQIVPGTKTFLFNSWNGGMSFTPMLYTTPLYNNNYLVSFKIDEYRKINGVMTKIGSIRRETCIMVIDPGANITPRLANLQTNYPTNPQDSVFNIRPGQPFNFQVDGFDDNSADSVFLASDAATMLPGATFTTNTAAKQKGTLTWTPTASQVSRNAYHFRIWVRDNAQPFAARQVQTFTLYVRNSGVTGTKAALTTGQFSAFPNPFTNQISFRLPTSVKAQEIRIFNVLGQELDQLNVAPAQQEKALPWVNAAKYPAGTYVARLVAPDKSVQVIKFIKQQ